MEFTRKFVLVPNDHLSKHLPTEENLSELDKEMNIILKNRNITDDEKVKLYMQVLQKKLHIYDHNNDLIKDQETTYNLPVDDSQEPINNLPSENQKEAVEDLILQSTPKNFKTNTRNILNYLKTSKNVIDWTSKGELIYKSKIIKNSNVLDLIKFMQIPSKQHDLIGKYEFQQALKEINLPISFIKNNTFAKETEIKEISTEERLPMKKKRIQVKLPNNWISLRNTRKRK